MSASSFDEQFYRTLEQHFLQRDRERTDCKFTQQLHASLKNDSQYALKATVLALVDDRLLELYIHLSKALELTHPDSPIEDYMLLALVIVAHHDFRFGYVTIREPRGNRSSFPDHRIKDTCAEARLSDCHLRITPQKRIDRYTVDFELLVSMGKNEDDWEEYSMVLECDGHNFHERTKEQAKRDRSMDRRLQSLDYKIYRYTGSEIWIDVVRCAKDALEQLLSLFSQQEHREQLDYAAMSQSATEGLVYSSGEWAS